jgi:hypothetical protein
VSAVMYGLRAKSESGLTVDCEGIMLLFPNICLANDVAAAVMNACGETLIPVPVIVGVLGE